MSSSINLQARLSTRIGIYDIHEIIHSLQQTTEQMQPLFDLLFHDDDLTAYQAAWICTHLNDEQLSPLLLIQKELIDEVTRCPHGGKRRLLLNLLLRQPLPDPPRVDFLDFCLERMNSPQELPGVKSLCMKLAYEQCRHAPELMQELRMMLEMIEQQPLLPSMRCVIKQLYRAMKKNKSLR